MRASLLDSNEKQMQKLRGSASKMSLRTQPTYREMDRQQTRGQAHSNISRTLCIAKPDPSQHLCVTSQRIKLVRAMTTDRCQESGTCSTRSVGGAAFRLGGMKMTVTQMKMPLQLRQTRRQLSGMLHTSALIRHDVRVLYPQQTPTRILTTPCSDTALQFSVPLNRMNFLLHPGSIFLPITSNTVHRPQTYRTIDLMSGCQVRHLHNLYMDRRNHHFLLRRLRSSRRETTTSGLPCQREQAIGQHHRKMSDMQVNQRR